MITNLKFVILSVYRLLFNADKQTSSSCVFLRSDISHICIHTCIYVYISVCVCVCCVCVCLCACVRACVYLRFLSLDGVHTICFRLPLEVFSGTLYTF